jgi:hypothetical protein
VTKRKKRKGPRSTRDLVETAIDLSKKPGTWEELLRGQSAKLSPPVLTREQILAALKRAAPGANERLHSLRGQFGLNARIASLVLK